MGQVEQRTRLARLLVAPPPVVYEELKSYSADVQTSPYTAASEELEANLAARNDPLIDLAIASFGASHETIGELYRKGKSPAVDGTDAQYRQGLRLAVLANETIDSKGFLSRFPENTIGEAELAFVMTSSDWIEAETLILNPTIADDVLLALYRGDKFCEGMDGDRRRQLVSMSGRNERLHTRNDDEHGPDMGHYYLHKAIFAMLGTVTTSDKWLWSLSYLLKQLAPDQVSNEESIDAVLERWILDENGEEEKPSDRDKYTDTGLSERAEFRCLIAALYGKSYGKKEVIIHGTADADDIARRCAYYGNAKLDAKAITEGHEKDGEAFVFAAMTNDDVLMNKQQRKIFEEDCLNGGHLYRYQRRCEQLHKRWKWFDPRPTAEWMVDEDTETHESKIEQQFRNLSDRMKAVEKAVALLPWLIGALAVAVLWRG